MSKIKALILDAGGVLVHPIHGNWNIPVKYRELLGDYAQDIPGEKWLEACRAEAEILREDVFVKDIAVEHGLRLEFLKKTAARLGWTLDEGTFAALAEDFTYNTDRYVWYGDVPEWLEKWSGKMSLGMLSDAMPSFRHVMNHTPNNVFFKSIVISTEVGVAKPNAKMYNEVCAQLGVAPEDCLFADDREGNLIGAMNCGMRAVQMCRDGLPHWDGPWVHDLSELNSYMEGLN